MYCTVLYCTVLYCMLLLSTLSGWIVFFSDSCYTCTVYFNVTKIMIEVFIPCCLTGWRPAFRYYSKWVALGGSAMCLAIMFVISWWAALVTFIAVGALYLLVYWRKPGIIQKQLSTAFLYTCVYSINMYMYILILVCVL